MLPYKHNMPPQFTRMKFTFPVFNHTEFKLAWNTVQCVCISDFTAHSAVYFSIYISYTEIKRETFLGSGSRHG